MLEVLIFKTFSSCEFPTYIFNDENKIADVLASLEQYWKLQQ